jgi:hypothetical protein
MDDGCPGLLVLVCYGWVMAVLVCLMAVLVCCPSWFVTGLLMLVCYPSNDRKKGLKYVNDLQLHSQLHKINPLRPRFLCRRIRTALLKR